jgi:hypothetical protein
MLLLLFLFPSFPHSVSHSTFRVISTNSLLFATHLLQLLYILFRPRHATSRHDVNSNRSSKQARVEWDAILNLNWVTTVLYPTSPWRKVDYESVQHKPLANCLCRRLEELCRRIRCCDLVVRAPNCRYRGPGFDPGATSFSEKLWLWNGAHSVSRG